MEHLTLSSLLKLLMFISFMIVYRIPATSKGIQNLDGTNGNRNMSPMRSIRAYHNNPSGFGSASNSPRGTPVRTFNNQKQQSMTTDSKLKPNYHGDTDSRYSG